MFDIGFWEIILIAVVALLVVGPDKFPGLIKETARWAARLRRFVLDTKREIEREVRFEEIEKGLTSSVADLENLAAPPAKKEPEPTEKGGPATDKQASA